MNAAFNLIRNNTKVLKLSVISHSLSLSLPSHAAHKKWMNIFYKLSNGKNKAIWHDFHTTTNALIKHIKMANGDIYISKSDNILIENKWWETL